MILFFGIVHLREGQLCVSGKLLHCDQALHCLADIMGMKTIKIVTLKDRYLPEGNQQFFPVLKTSHPILI